MMLQLSNQPTLATRHNRVYTRVMKICYCDTLRKAARRVSALYDQALEPAGVNLAQFSLLRKIGRNAPVSLTELGRLSDLDRSTVGRNVRVLERMGLVAPAEAQDLRETAVELTEAGRNTLTAGAPLWEGAQQRIEAGLGANVAQLEALLATL